MKKAILCTITLVGLALLTGAKEHPCCATEKAQYDAAEKAILDVHNQVIAAAEKLDAETMFSYILSNDKGAIIQDGQLLTRQESLNQVKMAFAGTESLKYNFKQQNIKMLSPTIALLTATGTVTSTMSSQTFTSSFANTTVFILQDNEWKIIHG
nr:nuclear transport factor 2 family protein [Planctomycetota bacterium]